MARGDFFFLAFLSFFPRLISERTHHKEPRRREEEMHLRISTEVTCWKVVALQG